MRFKSDKQRKKVMATLNPSSGNTTPKQIAKNFSIPAYLDNVNITRNKLTNERFKDISNFERKILNFALDDLAKVRTRDGFISWFQDHQMQIVFNKNKKTDAARIIIKEIPNPNSLRAIGLREKDFNFLKRNKVI